jgi:drug/metabolite transporter (DMT)-like permease
MIKVGLRDSPPVTAAGLRFFLAALIIFGIVRRFRIRLPRTRAFFRLTLYLGLFQLAIPYAMVYWAEQYLTAGLTAVLFSTMPLMVAILARFILGDPLTASKAIGIIAGLGGVYVIFADSLSLGGRAGAYGVLAAVGSAFFASLSSVLVKKYSRNYPPFATISLPHVYGAVLLLAAGAAFEKDNPLDWGALTFFTVAYLAVLGSVVAFALYFWIIKHIDVTVLSYQTFVIPVVAVLLGWIFLGETITIHTAIGGFLVLAGIVLAVLPGSRKRFARAGS